MDSETALLLVTTRNCPKAQITGDRKKEKNTLHSKMPYMNVRYNLTAQVGVLKTVAGIKWGFGFKYSALILFWTDRSLHVFCAF